MVKIDSRLKGPVAALVAAALASTGRRGAVICPAVPDMGRFVVDGRIVGIGVDRPIEVAAHFPAGAGVTYRDADSAAMLRDVAASIVDHPELLAVGARGLAQALAAATAPRSRPPIRMPECARAPLILAIGSRDPITAEQLDRMSRATAIVDGNALLRGEPRTIDGSIVLIRPDGGGVAREPAKVSAELAEAVARLVDACAAVAILASGGDTAMAIARRLGIRVLVPRGELAPGVPLSFDAARPDVLIATKSGGFGDPDTLVRCLGAIFRDEALSPRRAGAGA